MNSDAPLDYALFQLSPKRTRCELFVSGNGRTEKLATGFLKPFMTHLKVAEEQVCHGVQAVRLEVEQGKSSAEWFNKGTVERFVRFVSTPEVLELVNTFDAELSQLEGARKIYSQGAGGQYFGESGINTIAAADATKKELLRAIDVRLVAVKQDLATACVRASAAGFRLETVSQLLRFAEQFGAFCLSEACKKFLSVCQQRPELFSHLHALPLPASHPQWKGFDDANVRSSSGSDMSIDEPEIEQNGPDKLKTTKYFGGQHCSKSMSEQQLVMAESVTTISMLSRPHSQQFAGNVEEPALTATSSSEPAQAVGGGSKRLSVQDRINLFESKQKQSVSVNLSGGSSSTTSIVRLPGAKVEHRRSPSEASVEKSVLRRWSGASDMSIELNSNSSSNNQKEGGSTTATPTSSVNLQTNSRNTDVEASGLKEASKSKSLLSSKNRSMATSTFSSSQDQDETTPKGKAWLGDAVCREDAASNSVASPTSTLDKGHGLTRGCTSGSLDGPGQSGLADRFVSQTRSNGFSNSGKVSGLKESTASMTDSKDTSVEIVKDPTVSGIPSRSALSPAVLAETRNQTSLTPQSRDKTEEPDIAVKSHVTSLSKHNEVARKKEDIVGIKSKDASVSGNQLIPSNGKMEDISAKGISLQPQTHENTSNRKQKETTHKSVAAPQVPKQNFLAEAQASASQGMRFLGKTSGANQMKLAGKKDANCPVDGSDVPVSRNRKAKEVLEVTSLSASVEEPYSVQPTKCNQELNDELQMKADKLEKLFAEHKLRIHGDLVASSRRSKTSDGHLARSVDKTPIHSLTSQVLEKSLQRQGSGNMVEINSNLLLKMVDKSDLSDSNSQKIRNLTPADESRGKLYGRYMQKRDDKLREESRSKRVQKEAKMKAMHDSLELSQAELKARFAGCSEGRDIINARHRAEKMRSFNSRSTLKNTEQTSESLTEEDEDEQELSESSSGNLSQRHLISKNLSSSNSRTSVNATPKQSVKSINSGSFRRQGQSETPVAHSVPNLSDFKNENPKPSMLVSKVSPHGQPRSYGRSKSSMENTEILKEDQARRSNSMRKGAVVHGELKDLSSFNTENSNMVSGELRQYVKKGNDEQQGSGRLTTKMKPIISPEDVKHEEESDDLVNDQENTLNMIKDDEEFKRASAKGNNQVMDLSIDSDTENFRQRQGSGKPESANNDSGIIFPKFNSASTSQYSPEDSPGSWNSQVHNSLVYTQEASDVDASMDSPIDSPASWNLHPLNQLMDTDAARMRKKWGSAQIPVIAAGASHQSRRDVTKGFKRLLKFGRKSRGAEYLVSDWVSASTTSEGDDDTEDGRDLIARPSDDFRKSRMGYSMNEGINDSNAFPEQAPRSFFSLSSFRSKPSESKPR
ncbi:hypothetical protein AXF42_Ash005022 [Apostasia shenzhenica]|uniref:COP1-interacting protein 7 n=1 Tax=Apostasia shenzhenica TaxID=1088818 RepID=A0A2I0B897_9ASPA|nr:hypothetical protein AXF42_Ash005022 [Apostasia shenzhenica]